MTISRKPLKVLKFIKDLVYVKDKKMHRILSSYRDYFKMTRKFKRKKLESMKPTSYFKNDRKKLKPLHERRKKQSGLVQMQKSHPLIRNFLSAGVTTPESINSPTSSPLQSVFSHRKSHIIIFK